MLNVAETGCGRRSCRGKGPRCMTRVRPCVGLWRTLALLWTGERILWAWPRNVETKSSRLQVGQRNLVFFFTVNYAEVHRVDPLVLCLITHRYARCVDLRSLSRYPEENYTGLESSWRKRWAFFYPNLNRIWIDTTLRKNNNDRFESFHENEKWRKLFFCMAI